MQPTNRKTTSIGEIILEEFLERNMTVEEASKKVDSLREIIYGEKKVERNDAEQLAAFFGTSVELWINLGALQ